MRSNSIIHSNSIMKPLSRFVIEGHGDGGNLNAILLARKKLRNKIEVSVAAASVAPERVEVSAGAPRAMAGRVEVSAAPLSATVTGAAVSAATPNAAAEANASCLWYLKATERVELEIVANEFGRLVIPSQPKTRLVQAGVGGKKYVASKEVAGFTPFKSMDTNQLWEGFANNQYKGLAAICIYALLVNEYDMHMGNVGLDANNQAVKIDGDHDFISIPALQGGRSIDNEGQQITAQVLAELPMVYHYKPANWLDKIERKGNFNSDDLIAIQQSPYFREEMFHTILCYLVLPDKLIQEFVNQYFPENTSLTISLTTEIQSRLQQLKLAAFGLPEFITFLQSNRASTAIENYWNHLSGFSCVGKTPLVKQAALSRVKLLTQLTHLRAECHANRPISPPLFDLQSVDDLINIMPNLSQASMRRDFERYDCIERHFLLRVEQMVVGGLLSDSDKDRLVDEAHHHDLQAFGMLYYTLQTKANKNKFVPLGFYKILVMLLRQFINAQRMSQALQYANQIEDLLLQYQSRFVALSDMSTGLGEVSELINWRTLSMFDQVLNDDNKRQQFLHWRKSDVRIEKIFFRLGFHDSMLAIKNLSPYFFVGELDSSLILREIHKEGQFKNKYTAHDFPFLKEYLREKYLKQTDQGMFVRARGGSPRYDNRADVEAYIEKNREALACSRQSPILADTFVHTVFKQFKIANPLAAADFLHDFFCHSDYQYGMFSLNKMTDDVFTEKAEHEQSPLITLFYSLLDCSISAKDFFIALNFHFPWIVEFPASITEKILTRLVVDSIAPVDVCADEDIGGQRLSQAGGKIDIDNDTLLNIINNESTIATSVKDYLLITILTKHLIPHCTLSAAVLLPLYKKFSLSHKIIDPHLHYYFLNNLRSILSKSCEPTTLNLYINVINNAWLRELDTSVRHQLYALRIDLSAKFITQAKQRLFYSTQASLLAAKIGVSDKQTSTPISSGAVTKGDVSSGEATTESPIYQGMPSHANFGRPLS